MLQSLKKRQRGFTIIEVLIVLAIAGLILLIVFLAVPALNRSAHNTSAKNDVAGVLAAMSEYVDNNNGSLPTVPQSVGTQSGNTYYVGGTPAACAVAGANCATAKIGYYTADKIAIVAASTGPTFPGLGSVTIIEGAICNGNVYDTSNATSRNYVAEFTLVGGAQECQQGS
jgi:prepilin-type N-terminal cleavage/methylation domain-containing protein